VSKDNTYDRVIVVVVTIVGLFILFSLLASFLLQWSGRIEAGEGSWRPLFDLVIVLVSAVGGYLTGERVERGRAPYPPDELELFGEGDEL
jgi:hypothetical protein